MEFVCQNTDIPIPRVYACELDDDNDIGCPFSIMDYIHGNTAEELSRIYNCEQEGMPAGFEDKFWRQIAKIMVQLASVRVPKTGSIIRDSSGAFVVGPLVETGSGPYGSAAEFYADYPLALSKSLGEGLVQYQDQVVQTFCSLAASFQPHTKQGNSIAGFGPANYDLNPNNILVDREFNVLAVIDWESVVAVPDAALYRFPFLMGARSPIPGLVDAHPAVVKRQQLGRRFAKVVEAVALEEEEADAHKSSTYGFTTTGFFSKEALAFRSLVYIKHKQDWANEASLQGLKWLSEHDESQVVQFCLGN